MHPLFLFVVLIIFAGLLLVVPGEPTQRLSTMFAFLSLIVTAYGLFVEIPAQFQQSRQAAEQNTIPDVIA